MVTSTGGWPAWADRLAEQRLRDVLRSAQIGHAYFLSGPKGVGKSELARAFAQAICCTHLQAGDTSLFCGECRACRNVARNVHPDVERFDLASQALLADKPGRGGSVTIDTVRRLRASASLLPLESTRRLLVLDDAETLAEPAQQALLKTLEEPPRTVTLLVIADEPEALLETVRSRCQHIVVRPVSFSMIEEALQDLSVDPVLAEEIARLSRGCPAWAIAAARDKKLLQARRAERDSAIEWIGAQRYERLITAFRLGDQFAKRRTDVFGIVQAAVQVLREEMIGMAKGQEPDTGPRALFERESASALAISHAISASLQCLVDLDGNVRPRLALEAMVLAWPNSGIQAA